MWENDSIKYCGIGESVHIVLNVELNQTVMQSFDFNFSRYNYH